MKQVSARRKARAQKTELSAIRAMARQPRDAWWWGGVAVLIGAALLRLLFLSDKPLHHDEGVNGVFLVTLFRTGFYHYDPANYHGPSLYYLSVIPTAINNVLHWGHGLSTFVIRFVTAVFGVGVVWLILCLRRWLGAAGSLAAAAFAAVSPGFVFFSRYFIHEILFVFFTLGTLVAWLFYRTTGRQRYLMLASASAALLFTTKETWIITTAVWLIAIPCTLFYLRLRGTGNDSLATMPAVGTTTESRRKALMWAGVLFLAIGILLYTSFFTNPRGILDAFRTFTYWTKTGEHGIYNREWSAYLQWMWQEESPILLLGGSGTLLALLRARSRLLVFCAFWTIGIFAAYSLVPYKTPWLVLSLILPLALMAGYLIEEGFRAGARGGFGFALGFFSFLAAAAGVAFSLYQAIDVSFIHYDDDAYAYVYAHTNRDFLGLVNEIEMTAAADPAKKDIGIAVVSPEHWPLPWYLRDYPNVGYCGKIPDTREGYCGKIIEAPEPVLIALLPQVPEVERLFDGKYRRFSTHELRPGNTLVMFVRNDLRLQPER